MSDSVCACTWTSVEPDPAADGLSASHVRPAGAASIATALTVNTLWRVTRTHPTELPPATLVAVKLTSVRVPVAIDAGLAVIVQPPLAADTVPAAASKTTGKRVDASDFPRLGANADRLRIASGDRVLGRPQRPLAIVRARQPSIGKARQVLDEGADEGRIKLRRRRVLDRSRTVRE